MSLEKIIRDSLTSFIQFHIPDADLSAMDDVFLSYVTGVLEELGSLESSEEDFDMETFMEMLEGYIPGFADIGRVAVLRRPGKTNLLAYPVQLEMEGDKSQGCCPSDSWKRPYRNETIYEMMFELTGRLSEARNNRSCSSKPSSEMTRMDPVPGDSEARHSKLPASPEGAEAQEESELKKNVDLLLEMFPSCTLRQAGTVLSMAKGSLEGAVQMIVESEVQLDHVAEPQESQKTSKKEDLKDFILQKYMMVDSEEDKKTHRPLMPKEAPKKMIRYIENQVVSTKGERYKDMKKPESEEMKKTYINLKPARKYKFH